MKALQQTQEEVSHRLPHPEQLVEDTVQKADNVLSKTEPTVSCVTSSETLRKKRSETKVTKSVMNKSRTAIKLKLFSSIIIQNKWQKSRYLPSKLFVRKMCTEKTLYTRKCKYLMQRKGKHLLSVKQQVHKRADNDRKLINFIKNMDLKRGTINSDQLRYRSRPHILERQINDVSTNIPTKMVTDASVNTAHYELTDVETQTSGNITAYSMGTQTDYTVIQCSNQLKYNCHFCKKVYKGISALEKHVKRHIQKFLKFYCKTCEKSFGNGILLANHACINNSTSIPAITYFDDVDLVTVPVYKCGNCDAQFLTEGCYNEHKSKFHDTQEKLYTCIFCTEVMTSESALHAHLENHLLFIVN